MGWPTRTSRFCGRCGTPLAPPADPARHPLVALTGPTLVVLVLAAMVATPVALALSGTASVPSFLQQAPDLAVDVPRGEQVSPGLQGAEARAALAPWDPNRLHCEPAGCERWRVDLEGGVEEVIPFGEHVVVRIGERIVALDASTGAWQWAVPVAPEDSRTGAFPRPPRTHPSILAADDTRLVLGSGTSDLRLVGPDGTLRWDARLALPFWIWGAALTDELVVTVGPPPSPADGGVQLRALETTDGTDRWTTVVHELLDWSGGQFLVALEDGSVARLDPADGEVAVVYGPTGWAQAVGGSFVLLGHHHDGVVGTSALVRASDGSPVFTIEGNIDQHLVHGDTIVLHVHQPGPPAFRAVVALGDDGSVRWEHVVPSTVVPGCCPMLTADTEGRLHVVEEGGRHVVLDLATGDELSTVDPRPNAPHRWSHGDLTVTFHREGEQLQLSTPRGSATIPSGYGWVVRADPPVVVGPNGLLGVELVGPPPAPPSEAERSGRTDGSGRARRTR
jgi:hypothetical protein